MCINIGYKNFNHVNTLCANLVKFWRKAKAQLSLNVQTLHTWNKTTLECSLLGCGGKLDLEVYYSKLSYELSLFQKA